MAEKVEEKDKQLIREGKLIILPKATITLEQDKSTARMLSDFVPPQARKLLSKTFYL